MKDKFSTLKQVFTYGSSFETATVATFSNDKQQIGNLTLCLRLNKVFQLDCKLNLLLTCF